jgi:hypothetical protein
MQGSVLVISQYEDFLYFDKEECDQFIDPYEINKEKTWMNFVLKVLRIKKRKKKNKKYNVMDVDKNEEKVNEAKEDDGTKAVKNFAKR